MPSLAPGSKVSGVNGYILFGGYDFSKYENEWSLDPTAPHIDVGGFGESADSGVRGSPAFTASINGFAKGGHAASITSVLFSMFVGGADYPLWIYPEGTASGKDYFYGVFHITGLPIKAGRKTAQGFSMSLAAGVPGDVSHVDIP